MNQTDVERYSREGILFPVSVLTDDEVEYYRTRVEELEDRLAVEPRPTDFIQPQLFHRWAYDLVINPAVLDAVEHVLGPNILVHSCSIFSKRPHTTGFVAWHQDGHYWGLDEPRLTSAWVALTESSKLNGCLRVVPGSQSAGMPHVSRSFSKDNLLASGLEIAAEVAESDAVDVTLSPGEMSMHHVNIIHGSEPNQSAGKRIGVAIRYIAADVHQLLRHHDVIVARGRDDHNNYSLLREPPSGDIDESLRAQSEFGHRWMAQRLGAAD